MALLRVLFCDCFPRATAAVAATAAAAKQKEPSGPQLMRMNNKLTIRFTFDVTVQPKSNHHPWYQRGSSKAFVFDRQEPGANPYSTIMCLQRNSWYQMRMVTPAYGLYMTTSEDGGDPADQNRITETVYDGSLVFMFDGRVVHWFKLDRRGYVASEDEETEVQEITKEERLWSNPYATVPAFYLQCDSEVRMGVQIQFDA